MEILIKILSFSEMVFGFLWEKFRCMGIILAWFKCSMWPKQLAS